MRCVGRHSQPNWAAIYHQLVRCAKEHGTVKRTIEITIQTDQILQIYSRGKQRAWCDCCHGETDVVTIDTTHVGAGPDLEGMQKQLASQGWHTSLAPDGALWVCLASQPQKSTDVETALRRLIEKPPDRLE